jgi:HEAT repeat protein
MNRILILSLLVVATAAHPEAIQRRDVSALTKELGAPDPETRTRAACGLRELGSAAAAAIPVLVNVLGDGAPVDPAVCALNWWRGNVSLTSPGEQAASALVAIGARAFEPVLGALKSGLWIARRNAAWAMGAFADRRAVEALIAALKDIEAAVREQVAWALGALDDRTAAPALIEALKDPDDRVRRQVAWALGAIDDARAVDGLISALGDKSAEVRKQAAWALGAIGDSRALPGLLPALKDTDPGVRRQAAWAIGVVGK